MLSSMGIQAVGTKPHPSKNPIFLSPSTFSSLSKFPKTALNPVKSSASSYSPNRELDENGVVVVEQAREKMGVVVKPAQRPRLVVKFIWMEKNIGIAIDQVIPGGSGTIPLTPYYFWPRKDAWEELRVMLEGKPWISKKEAVVLLNQATDIINLWQQNGDSS
ncbi:hypothetical protein ABFS82_12G032700 [Erythranthe guttata]|uniref:30S ribosomal protein 3, chloroplastic-like n=1 Tax=Erythranthe guttata TaxID=4155 RepID=UPI00064E03A5|nr:PREDICTED: 30S ribosomal protein 3, chloroplastic-like [Erythranthe guttata]|eukprot:XP_012840986.1 PREDICTED: 30S ribosomal protein 3, chloroplastic-like [Erythranthe guttata]